MGVKGSVMDGRNEVGEMGFNLWRWTPILDKHSVCHLPVGYLGLVWFLLHDAVICAGKVSHIATTSDLGCRVCWTATEKVQDVLNHEIFTLLNLWFFWS